ncbi:MAG: hypothetical protein ACOYL6_12155 [Bacteriovoracaceae bacterium]
MLCSRFVFLFIIGIITNNLCSHSWAQVVQFSTAKQIDERGLESYTEVMVSVVNQESFADTSLLMQNFLGLPSKAPSFFLQANLDPKYIKDKNFEEPLDISNYTQNIAPSLFSETQKIELPSDWLDSFFDRTPAQVNENENFLRLEKEFHLYYKKNYRGKRMTLIAARTILNGTVASLGFIAGHMPVVPSMILGGLTGFLSGIVQNQANHINDYLATNKFQMKIKKLLGMKVSGEVKSSSFLMNHLKWYSLEIGFLTLLDITRFSLGVLPMTSGMGHEALSLSATAAKSLLSQGLVDTSVARDITPQIRAAILAQDFSTAAKLRFRGELSSFASSVTWAGAAISDMMGLPLGDYLFLGMGGVGGANHARLILKDKKNVIQSSIRRFYTCSKNFFQ